MYVVSIIMCMETSYKDMRGRVAWKRTLKYLNILPGVSMAATK